MKNENLIKTSGSRTVKYGENLLIVISTIILCIFILLSGCSREKPSSIACPGETVLDGICDCPKSDNSENVTNTISYSEDSISDLKLGSFSYCVGNGGVIWSPHRRQQRLIDTDNGH